MCLYPCTLEYAFISLRALHHMIVHTCYYLIYVCMCTMCVSLFAFILCLHSLCVHFLLAFVLLSLVARIHPSFASCSHSLCVFIPRLHSSLTLFVYILCLHLLYTFSLGNPSLYPRVLCSFSCVGFSFRCFVSCGWYTWYMCR
jgi:hypothetical protein